MKEKTLTICDHGTHQTIHDSNVKCPMCSVKFDYENLYDAYSELIDYLKDKYPDDSNLSFLYGKR